MRVLRFSESEKTAKNKKRREQSEKGDRSDTRVHTHTYTQRGGKDRVMTEWEM